MNTNEFVHTLQRATYDVSVPVRFIPSSFDANDSDLRAIPRPFDWRWSSCEQFLRHFQVKTVMMQLPLFWQMYSPLRTVCEGIAPIYPNEPENFPIGGAAIQTGDVNIVIIQAQDAAFFAKYLRENAIPLPSWIIVHRTNDAWELPEHIKESPHIAQEVHLFPGLPILHQCISLANAKTNSFHCSDEFAWSIGTVVTITSKNDIFALNQLILPFELEDRGQCQCGKNTFKKKI